MTRQKVCQPLAPSDERRLLLVAALLLHQRDQLAGDEREGDEDRSPARCPGTAKMILMPCACEQRAEPALRAEQQHVDQARDHRRDRERQVDQGDQQGSCRGSRTWRSHQAAARPKTVFSGTAIAATSRVSRIAASASGSAMAAQIGARRPWRSASAKTDGQRQQQEHDEEGRPASSDQRRRRPARRGRPPRGWRSRSWRAAAQRTAAA